MPVSEAMRRLLHLRALEEEQLKLALECSLGELHRLEQALAATRMRESAGRRAFGWAAQSEDAADRVAGLVAWESAQRQARRLESLVSEAGRHAAELREVYLAKRTERRQVETVIHESEGLEAADDARREQRSTDDWFGNRRSANAARRRNSQEREMKGHKESGSIPEEELRFKL